MIKVKRWIHTALILVLAFTVLLTGCGNKATTAEFDEDASFETLVSQAEGTTVTFYGWGGNEENNKWIDTVLAPTVKEKYGITLKRMPMDIEEVMSKLFNEKQANLEKGTIDMIWINGENFFTAKENNLLFGPVTPYLPNFEKYVDGEADEILYDYGYPTDGYESPYGCWQFVLINDSAVTPEQPKNTAELLEYAKKNQGKLTYPALPDFTGRNFVVNVIYDLVGHEKFIGMEADKATVKEAIEPALEYLRELNQYLWSEGKTFPATLAQLDQMFADGELVMTMSSYPCVIASSIENGIYPDTATSFVFENGMNGSSDFVALAANSPNKQAALVVMNEILSPEMQASRYEKVKITPVLDFSKLTDSEKELFDKVDLGKGILPLEELNEKKLPQMHAKLIPIVEEIWLEEVVGK
ncbi:MAG: ABC transporter substrate-binding protein [Desulfitobacterium sp.]|nr:ABC transporter substrate-binding protein [Desulfitobacterium sp.]